MRRRIKKSFNREDETKKMIYISASILLFVILAFIITFFAYSNILNNDAKSEISEESSFFELASDNLENTSQASTQMDKTVNEVEEDMINNEITNTVTNETTKIAINTSKIEKENTNTVSTSASTNESNETTEESEKVEDPTFIKPVEGEIIREFASDKLVYSNTLMEWVTHNGIDIKADKTTVVKASADGTVKSIKNDPRYGITVVIEHVNGYQTVYANLLTAEFVKENEEVKQGQTVGTVGNTAAFEIADDYHLHFEIIKDGLYLDPELYIK